MLEKCLDYQKNFSHDVELAHNMQMSFFQYQDHLMLAYVDASVSLCCDMYNNVVSCGKYTVQNRLTVNIYLCWRVRQSSKRVLEEHFSSPY